MYDRDRRTVKMTNLMFVVKAGIGEMKLKRARTSGIGAQTKRQAPRPPIPKWESWCAHPRCATDDSIPLMLQPRTISGLSHPISCLYFPDIDNQSSLLSQTCSDG